MTIAEFLQVYLSVRVGVSAEWAAEVKRVTARFVAFIGDIEITELTETHLSDFWQRYSGSERTKNNKTAIIGSLWREAYRMGYVSRPPKFVPRAKLTKPVPVAWTSQELEKLIATVEALPSSPIGGVAGWIWWKTLILLIYYTGARLGSILALEKSDVDLQRRLIRLRHTKNKREQLLAIPDNLVPFLEILLGSQGTELFPGKMRRQQVCKKLRRLVEKSGISGRKGPGKSLTHRIRRTHISYVYSVDPELARLQAGHVSLRTTIEHYVDPRIVDTGKSRPCDVLPKLDNSQKALRLVR